MTRNNNVEIIGLQDLKPDPQNARKHTARNVAMVVDALQEVGPRDPSSSTRKASFLPERHPSRSLMPTGAKSLP
jgi:hypothetical protein